MPIWADRRRYSIQGFGLTPAQYALIFGANSVGLICCAQLNPLLLRRFGHLPVLRAVGRVHLCATATLTVIAFAGLHRLPLVIAPLIVAISCMGMLNPNTIVGALAARHQQHTGSASSVMGTGQYLLGAISGLLVGLATHGTPRGMAALMLIGSLGMAVADATAAEDLGRFTHEFEFRFQCQLGTMQSHCVQDRRKGSGQTWRHILND